MGVISIIELGGTTGWLAESEKWQKRKSVKVLDTFYYLSLSLIFSFSKKKRERGWPRWWRTVSETDKLVCIESIVYFFSTSVSLPTEVNRIKVLFSGLVHIFCPVCGRVFPTSVLFRLSVSHKWRKWGATKTQWLTDWLTMLNSLARQILNRNPFLGRVRKGGGGGRERDNANQNITEQTNFSVDCSLVMKIAKVKMRKRESEKEREMGKTTKRCWWWWWEGKDHHWQQRQQRWQETDPITLDTHTDTHTHFLSLSLFHCPVLSSNGTDCPGCWWCERKGVGAIKLAIVSVSVMLM